MLFRLLQSVIVDRIQHTLPLLDMSTSSNEPRSNCCDWKTPLHDLDAAVSARVELVLVVYTLIAYGFTWVLGWVYVLELQHRNTSPPLILIGLAAFGPTISAFVTMGFIHRK